MRDCAKKGQEAGKDAGLKGKALGDDERYVVVLFTRTELADLIDDGSEKRLGRGGAGAAQRFDEPIFAELFTGVVEGFGDAVCVKSKRVSGR